MVENPPEMAVAKAMLNELGAFGNYVLQTKIDARDGKHKLIEINSRVGSNFRIICRFDINMPELLIKSLKGENSPKTFTIPIGTHGVSPFEDFLGIFSYFSYRLHYYLSKEKHRHNEAPSFGKLVKSFYHTYKQRPILDVYTVNFLKDPRESIWHVLFVLRSLGKRGTTAKLRFIPWGDLL